MPHRSASLIAYRSAGWSRSRARRCARWSASVFDVSAVKNDTRMPMPDSTYTTVKSLPISVSGTTSP